MPFESGVGNRTRNISCKVVSQGCSIQRCILGSMNYPILGFPCCTTKSIPPHVIPSKCHAGAVPQNGPPFSEHTFVLVLPALQLGLRLCISMACWILNGIAWFTATLHCCPDTFAMLWALLFPFYLMHLHILRMHFAWLIEKPCLKLPCLP